MHLFMLLISGSCNFQWFLLFDEVLTLALWVILLAILSSADVFQN